MKTLQVRSFQKKNTICGGSSIAGGYEGFNYQILIFKTFELPPHFQIIIRFKFWRIDQWEINDEFSVYVDHVRVHKYIYSSIDSSTNICGSNDYDSVIQFDRIVDHFSTSSTIMMTTVNGGWWGISEYRLYAIKCSFGCNSCNQYNCFKQALFLEIFNKKWFNIENWEGWYHNGNLVIEKKGLCGFNSLISPGDYLTNSFILGNHFAISLYLKVAIYNTITSRVDVEIDDNIVSTSQLNHQVPTYRDDTCGRVLILHQINIYQLEHTNNVLTIKIKVDLSNYYHYSVNFGIRDFQLFIKPDQDMCLDSNINPFDGCFSSQFSCIEGCSNCIKGICFQCQDGWEYITSIKHCVPKCGDSIINQYEECDDGNLISYDGCHLCQFQCPQDCLNCQFGKCLEYQQSIILIKNYCIFNTQNLNEIKALITILSILLIKVIKQLDFFRFHNQNNIKIQNCDLQLFGQCLKCQHFYQLSINKQKCIPNCNDGIKLYDEICDDNNNIQFDGCYKCQESCQLECLTCIQAQCYECKDGWQLVDYKCKFECDKNCFLCATNDLCFQCLDHFEEIKGKCIPICGDEYVVPGLEECDDNNQIPFDGCYQCNFQCDEKCGKCNQGNCIECQEGYEIDYNKKCLFIISEYMEDGKREQIYEQQIKCGDTIKQENEGCDDGNDISYDGCSQTCQVENNWQCNEDLPNKCYRITQILLTYLNQTYDKQFVNLTFSQKVKWQRASRNFSQAILTKIEGIENKIYITPVTPIDIDKPNNPVYQFEIQIFSSKSTPPILFASIQDGVIDEHDFNLVLASQELKLKPTIMLSNSQLDTANKFQTMGNYIMIGLGCCSVLMLLLGYPQSSIEIFDILQFQSYLRFIQQINHQIYSFLNQIQIWNSHKTFKFILHLLISQHQHLFQSN
ncbi:unnamed protein product [Paramecium sonneborni]|uniref:Uncharacterized protein n=1 Tax=Paramecium sonneborni TaxID=65129 RepID=A0A8S1RU11_9CILI|nr:unnamed protein product [Paramecium sonneborni]